MTGYKLRRSGGSGWMFCGVNAIEVANVLAIEMEQDSGLPTGERDIFTIEPFEVTQEEIDKMPEFPGW